VVVAQIEGRLGFWAGTPGAGSLLTQAAYLIGEVEPAAGGAALVEAAISVAYEDVPAGLKLRKYPLFRHAPELTRRVLVSSAQLASAQLFQKLEIRSRVELARLLMQQENVA
jgi:hypothetical protein